MASRHSYLVRKLSRAIEDVSVEFRGPLYRDGIRCKAVYENDTVVLDPTNHDSWDDLVVSFLHEALHHVDITSGKGDEWLIDEALDRVAFTSPKLRWLASRKIGDKKFGYVREKQS